MEQQTKVLGFLTIHYAGDYLRESLLSVVDHVDKLLVAYSYGPSQGQQGSGLPCPDTRDDIFGICQSVLGDKLIWDEKQSYPSEGEHRGVKNKYSKDYDIVLTVDCDEVMLGISQAIEYALQNKERHFGIAGYKNFFRSFSWYVEDGFRPIRLEVMGRDNHEQNLNCPMEILHFSTAQRREIMEYKYKNFGHSSEIRPNYLEDVFYRWTPESDVRWLHCVSLQIWETAKPYDKQQMPEYLRLHKNFNLDLIP